MQGPAGSKGMCGVARCMAFSRRPRSPAYHTLLRPRPGHAGADADYGAAAPGTAAPGAWPDAGYGGTIRAVPDPQSAAAAAAPPRAPGGRPGAGAPPAGAGGEGPRAVYKRLPSLQALSVDVGHVPGGGAAAGLPAGSGDAPEVTILRRFSRQESGAAAGEGEAALGRLLLPALRALVPVLGGPEQVGRGLGRG